MLVLSEEHQKQESGNRGRIWFEIHRRTSEAKQRNILRSTERTGEEEEIHRSTLEAKQTNINWFEIH